VAAEFRVQLGRLRKLGRTYQEMDEMLLREATRAVRQSNAMRAGVAGGEITVLVDGAIVVFRSANGDLTPTETIEQLSAAGVKGSAVSGATAAAVLLGANPVGLTVIVVGGITYVVVDYVIEA